LISFLRAEALWLQSVHILLACDRCFGNRHATLAAASARYWRARSDRKRRAFPSPRPSARVCTSPRPAFAVSGSADIQWGCRSVLEERRPGRPNILAPRRHPFPSPAPEAALPFPKIDRAAGVEKGLPRTQLERAQGLGDRLTLRKLLHSWPWTRKINQRPSHPRTARKTSSKSGRSRETGTVITRMTMGFTLRRTARKIARLNGALEGISSA
jgi:hypothetical protein